MAIALHVTVLSGDTMSAIASNVSGSAGISYQQIEQANPAIDPNTLGIGQHIQIPAHSTSSTWTYVIQPGDTLGGIAAGLGHSAGLTAAEIEGANPSVNANALAVGSVLAIPVAGEPAPPAPAPEPAPAPVHATYVGYWDQTWNPTQPVPGATLGVAFSGWNNLDNVFSQSARVKDSLAGEKYISLGGGSQKTGSFNAGFLQAIQEGISGGKFAGWDGICYDIEVGDAGLGQAFASSFAAAKQAGFKVLVTVSHSMPYGISDGAELMHAFLADENIDILAPQLYSTGTETANQYADYGFPWTNYQGAKPAIAPSIVRASLYPSAVEYFQQQGVELQGYVQWAPTS